MQRKMDEIIIKGETYGTKNATEKVKAIKADLQMEKS